MSGGGLRINGERKTKPSTNVVPGDTLTFEQARQIRVVRIIAEGSRRGPATEAQELYEDLSPPPETRQPEPPRVGPRPTKKDRRDMDRARGE